MTVTGRRQIRLTSLILLAGLAAPGCTRLTRGPGVPQALAGQALLPGMPPSIRTWGAELNPEFEQELLRSVQRERAHLERTGYRGPLPRAEYLAISGGGANGAFGAGLLNGWTAAGNRPEFKLVTGVSTGALIAPFAFLGPRYDETLHKFYTQIRTKDVAKRRSLLDGLAKDALADNHPLLTMLESIVDEKMLAEIAAEHEKGRMLAILTTDIDARRAVIWNITAIAATDHPDRLKLIHSVMLASAAIPVVFPPSMIDVEVDGARYQEMHVDGGCTSQVFVYPPSLELRAKAAEAGATRDRRLYIIRNGRLDADWAETERRTLGIAGRAIASLLHTQGIGDLYRIYLNAQRDRIDYNLAFIPATFQVTPREAFDPAYMGALYQVGYDLARSGYPWQKTPPMFKLTADDDDRPAAADR